jgi:hypothetical protein
MRNSTMKPVTSMRAVLQLCLVALLLSSISLLGANQPDSPAQSVSGETVTWQVSGAGGGRGTTTGYVLSGTVGQTAVLKAPAGDFQLAQGFWQGFTPFVCGDVDGNGLVNIADAVAIMSYVFMRGSVLQLLAAADPDCSGNVNISDAVYLIAFIFDAGPAPCANCL